MPALLALVMVFSLIIATPFASAADNPPGAMNQLDFAKKIIDTFGWSEGLPENPGDKDYLAILNGNRTFKFEAEDIFDRKTDTIASRNYPLFGPFSGSGWLHGSLTPVAVHFRAFMPVSGTYTFIVSARGGEQLWSIAGRAFKVTFGESLKEKKVGQVFIPSGFLEFNTLIPPAAGIDYLIFTAPAQPAIEPAAGWNFNAPLTATALAETVSALLRNEQRLPDDTKFAKLTVAASTASIPLGAQLTDTGIYGKPASEKWVRASQNPVSLSIPIQILQDGVYCFRIRCMGTEISAGFGAKKATLPAKPYLEWLDLGTFRLQKGNHALEIQLPSSGGVDLVEISRKLSSAADYLALNKLGIREDAVVRPEDIDAVLKTLQEQPKERK